MLVRWFLEAELGWNHHHSSHHMRVRVLLGVGPHSSFKKKNEKKNKERSVGQANTGTQPACVFSSLVVRTKTIDNRVLFQHN
jgi:hypothetical protein